MEKKCWFNPRTDLEVRKVNILVIDSRYLKIIIIYFFLIFCLVYFFLFWLLYIVTSVVSFFCVIFFRIVVKRVWGPFLLQMSSQPKKIVCYSHYWIKISIRTFAGPYWIAKNCKITLKVICDQIKITCSKSDLRSDQDHDLEYCKKVICNKITWSKSDLRSDQDHFLPKRI